MKNPSSGSSDANSLLSEFDIFGEDQVYRADPYPYYEAARANGPIIRERRTGVFIATSYRDILDIERRHQDFSAAVSSIGPYSLGQVPAREEESRCPFGDVSLDDELDEWRANTHLQLIAVLTLDPPDHTEYRNLVNRLFTPKRKKDLEPILRGFAHELIDSFIEDGEVEWVARFSAPYTYFTMNEVMDLPRASEEQMRKRFIEGKRRSTRSDIDGTGPVELPEEENPTGVSQATFLEYLQDRRESPQDDVLSEIATATFASGELPDLENLVGISSVMYGAGQGTTMHWIGTIMLNLARDSAMQDHLRENPDRILSYVEEILRYDPPVQGLFRYARRDTYVGAVPIPAGSVIWMNYAAGNRDPEVFDDPLTMDPDRENAYKGISFGAGRHFCPGQPLAKLEARITVEEVLKRLRNIRLKFPDEPIKYPEWFVVRGPETLHILFDKA